MSIHMQENPAGGGGQLLSPEQLAEYLGVPLATIYRWRTRGAGPVGHKVGRHVRYRLRTVDAWLDQQADPQSAA
jgi:excisionase family DNA binding protein